MTVDPSKKHSAHPVRKKILGIVLRVVLVILFLEFVVYFGSNIFMAEYAQRKVNEATEDVYLIEFNRINFSLIRRGIFLNGLVMKPVHPEARKSGQTLFDFKLDEVGIRGIWYDFFSERFVVNKIFIDNPNIQLDLPEGESLISKPDSSGIASPVRYLEEEIRKSLGKIKLSKFLIREVEIAHANVFFFNFLSRGNLQAANTSLIVRDIDLSPNTEWKTPFNAAGFEFKLEDVTFPLPDQVHMLTANRVFISSLDKLIDIKDFKLFSDRTKASQSYYTVQLEKLLMGNVDLNRAFMTSELKLDELILNDPQFHVLTNPGVKSDLQSTGDLNDFIRGQLKSVSIKELAINRGKFIRALFQDTLKNRIELDGLNFKMIDFYLGDDLEKRENQFFYGQDASMEIQKGQLYLGDGIHRISGNSISVSSFKDELVVKDLQLLPLESKIASFSPKNLIRIKLPELSLDEIDLKRLYNLGVFAADEVNILSPEVEYMELNQRLDSASRGSVSDLISGFLERVEVKRLRVSEGTMQFTDDRGIRSNDIGFDQFSFGLDGLTIVPDLSLPFYEQFHSDEIFFSLDNYLLKLKDNLHVFEAAKIKVDSRSNLLEIRDLKIQPEDESQIQSLLDQYGKTSTVQIRVPLLRSEEIDIQQALLDQRLEIGLISMPKPSFQVVNYRRRQASSDGVQSSEDIRGLLLGYFDQIHVDSVRVDQAKINFQSQSESLQTKFEEDDFNLSLKNFSLYPNDTTFTSKTLFSEEIDLTFKNYLFNLTGGKYLVEVDQLNYNSKKESLTLDGLNVRPGQSLQSRVSLGLDFPKVELKGVNIEQFVFEDILDLEKIEIAQGNVEVAIDREIKSRASDRTSRNVPRKNIQQIDVDSIVAKDSQLQLNFQTGNRSARAIQTGFEFFIQDFHLDTLAVDRSELASLYSSATLNLDSFVFALPDSIHTVSFSNLILGDQQKEVLFENFKISPKNLFGKPGMPVLDATIKELGLQSTSIPKILETQQVDINSIRLSDAAINLYLDDETNATKEILGSKSDSKIAFVSSFLLHDAKIERGKLQILKKSTGPINGLNFPSLDLSLQDMNLDLMGKNQNADLLKIISDKASFGLSDYRWYSKDSIYRFDISRIDYDNQTLLVKGILIRPTFGLYGQSHKNKFQSDVIQGKVESIRVDGLAPLSFLENRNLQMKSLTLDGVNLDIFRDKRIPFDTLVLRYMVQDLMKNAYLNADIGSIHVKNSGITYFEFAKEGNLPGRIAFEDLQVDMAPFYLRKKDTPYPIDRLRAGIRTSIMGNSDIQLAALMSFDEKSTMDVAIEIGELDLVSINDFLEKTLYVKIQDGKVDYGNWEFTLDDDYAVGEMRLAYSDLKLQFVDSLTYDQGKGKLKLLGFLVNTFAKNDNPRGGSSRIVRSEIYQQRDKSKFIFNAWWKATLSGLRGTFGLGKAKIPKEIRKEEDD